MIRSSMAEGDREWGTGAFVPGASATGASVKITGSTFRAFGGRYLMRLSGRTLVYADEYAECLREYLSVW